MLRRRVLSLPVIAPLATKERLVSYLALVDRPLKALLAKDRLQPVAPGHFIYQSNPYQVLRWQVVPSVNLQASWGDEQWEVRSTSCRLDGFREGMGSLGFTLEAVLRAKEAGLAGWAEVGIHSRLVTTPIGHRLGSLALEAVLDRIERRVGRGLRRDVAAWLGEEADTTKARE